MGSVYPEYLISELERGDPGPLTERSRFLFLGGTGDQRRELIARYPEKLGYIAASDVLKPSNEWFDKLLTTAAFAGVGGTVVSGVLAGGVIGTGSGGAMVGGGAGTISSLSGAGMGGSMALGGAGLASAIKPIAGVGGSGDVAAAAMEQAAAPSVEVPMTLEEMADQWLAEPALPGAGEVAPAGTFWDSVSGTWKAVTGGIDTLATVIPKIGTIYRTIEGVLGKEGQETVPVTQNPSNPPPSSSSPVINLTIPPQSTGGIVLTTPAAEQPNYMLYAGLAIIAIILFKGL